MTIILNNNTETFPYDSLSVSELMKEKNFTFKMLIVRINGVLIKKTEYDSSEIKEGDDVMILHLISGG